MCPYFRHRVPASVGPRGGAPVLQPGDHPAGRLDRHEDRRPAALRARAHRTAEPGLALQGTGLLCCCCGGGGGFRTWA